MTKGHPNGGRDYPHTGIAGWCKVHQKQWHMSKKSAKTFLRRHHHPGKPRIYPCDVNDTFWHIGHLPRNVIKGLVDRATVYNKPRRLITRSETDMDVYTTETPGYHTGPADPPAAANGHRTQGDNMAGNRMLDALLKDLTTYRYETQVPVTPSLARRLIDLNADNNRNLLNRTVETYARDMRAGKWQEKTGQTIKVDTEGRLIDGNHRAHAVAASGATIVFDLAFGISPGAIVVIDSHKARNRDAVIKTAGGGDLQGVSACVTWVWAYDRGYYTGTAGSMTPTATEIIDTYLADRNMFEAAARRGADLQARGIVAKSIGATAYYVLSRVNKAEADDMFDMLVSGIYGVPDPSKLSVYHLREKLIRRRDLRLTRPEQLALFMMAWNRRDEIVEKFQIGRGGGDGKLTNANFPQPRQRGRAYGRPSRRDLQDGQ